MRPEAPTGEGSGAWSFRASAWGSADENGMKRVSARLLVAAAIAVAVPISNAAVGSDFANAAVNPPVVRAFGTAPKFAGPSVPLRAGVVAVAADASGKGYWSLSADGGVFTSGNSTYYGSPNANTLAGFATDIASTPTGNGYWIVTTHGAVYHYGDARWFGSARDHALGKPVVGIAPTPTGRGYWLVTSGGRVFAFGDAQHRGNAVSLYIPPRISDIAASPSGRGYALLDATGYVYSFGDAKRITLTKPTARPAVAIATTQSGAGYWVLGHDGSVVRYGDAAGLGQASNAPVIAIDLATTRRGSGYWIATGSKFPPVPANSGDGRRIVYSNGQQRIWLIETNGVVSHSFRVSGRTGAPPFGTYFIASKSEMSSSGSLRLPYMSRFYKASSGKWIGFHGIPLRPDGTPIQTDEQLGQPLSHGCVRMNQQDVKVVWDFTPIGTKIVVVG